MEYNVPQFIEEEAKILGPLTLRDFFIIFGAFLTSTIFFFIFKFWLFIILTIIVMGTSIAMVLVKINGRPLYIITIAAIRYFWLPKFYIWKKEEVKTKELIKEKEPTISKTPQVKTAVKKHAEPLSYKQIKELAEKLDVKF